MKNQYVILTGSKNNAGDFLIKKRAMQLFDRVRPDREIIDFNGWESLDEAKLSIINASRALILMGGPSIVKSMVPIVYNLENFLDRINVPVILMGVGWKSKRGNWEDTYCYELNEATVRLLNKTNSSGYYSSVRDYHTLNVLRDHGISNVLMTGCPAYYSLDKIGSDFSVVETGRVAFSLGVSFMESSSMCDLMKENILECKKMFKNEFEVVFHHSLKRQEYMNRSYKLSEHAYKHNKFADWLDSNGIGYVDISGSAEKLMDYYKQIDIHIGYRVHAHIFMNSISKMSILISEDGRAKGVKSAINGIVLDGFIHLRGSILHKALSKLLPSYDLYSSNASLSREITWEYEYEKLIDYARLKTSRKIIDSNYQIMHKFLQQLP